AIEDEERVALQCNGCGTVVGTVHAKILKAREQAITDSIATHKFQEADAPEGSRQSRRSASAENAHGVPACSIDSIRAISWSSACTPAIESNAVQARLCDRRASSTSILDLSA